MIDPASTSTTPPDKEPGKVAAADTGDSRSDAAKQYDAGIDHQGGDEDSAIELTKKYFRDAAKRRERGEPEDPAEQVEKGWKV